MFRSFRWKIALWFVGLSSLNYLLFALFGAWFFYSSLTRSIDEELRVVASQIGHAIDLEGARPTFRDWLRVVKTQPARSLISMQLFNSDKELLEHYGPVGVPRLMNSDEVRSGKQLLRVRVTPLEHNGTLIGYLQLQLPTDKREDSTREFLLTMGAMAPLVLLGFGVCSYAVSGIAARPIEELVSTLKRFVVDAGHELNTPASIMRARAQSLQRKLASRGLSLAEEDIHSIVSSSERMGHIVQDLMLLAELEAQCFASPEGKVSLNDVVKTVAYDYSPRFAELNIAFHVGNSTPAAVRADRESVERVLRNLLENALKFTEPGGTVNFALTVYGAEVCLSVEDTGIGIAPEHINLIFDRFYRVDKSRSRTSGGSGLGLSILKATVESMHGRVHVTSQLGKGTRFEVYLPSCNSDGVAQKLHTRFGKLD